MQKMIDLKLLKDVYIDQESNCIVVGNGKVNLPKSNVKSSEAKQGTIKIQKKQQIVLTFQLMSYLNRTLKQRKSL